GRAGFGFLEAPSFASHARQASASCCCASSRVAAHPLRGLSPASGRTHVIDHTSPAITQRAAIGLQSRGTESVAGLRLACSKPLRNQRTRCSEVPWVKDSGGSLLR